MASTIVTYHSLDESGSVISTQPALFRLHMQALLESGVPIVPLADLRERNAAVALTFDDGYANFSESALPLLAEHRIPATVFIVSGHCGQFNAWEQANDISKLPLMDWPTLRALPPFISLGAHSVSHPDLTQISPASVVTELSNSRTEIEQRTGRSVRHFAYPYGRSTKAIQSAATEQYEMAVGTQLDHVQTRSDRMDLPRIDAYYLRSINRFRHQIAGEGRAFLAVRRWLRELRHLRHRS